MSNHHAGNRLNGGRDLGDSRVRRGDYDQISTIDRAAYITAATDRIEDSPPRGSQRSGEGEPGASRPDYTNGGQMSDSDVPAPVRGAVRTHLG